MQQNVKEVAICESGLFPCPYTEGKTFKTNPSNLSWSEFRKGWEELMQGGRGGGVRRGEQGLFAGKKLFVRYSFIILFGKEILYSGI